MIDDKENNGVENEQEDNFPSFLRSDNPENYDNDINHFLNEEKLPDAETIGIGEKSDEPDNWSDSFTEADKSEDLDLELESANFDFPDSQIKFINDEEAQGEKTTAIPDPEEYMSFDVPLEAQDIRENKTETLPIEEASEDEPLPPETPVSAHDLPQEISSESSDEPYVEVLPGDQNMNPDEYMSYDLPEETMPLMPDEGADEISDVVDSGEPQTEDEPAATLSFAPTRTEQEEKETLQMFKWYSGRLSDNYFRFSADAPSAEFAGSPEQNSIYVDVGTSAYGWNVSFNNGINMNLADAREFQLRNGRLPDNDGVIVYGETVLRFRNVERIVIGSIPEYYHYGI